MWSKNDLVLPSQRVLEFESLSNWYKEKFFEELVDGLGTSAFWGWHVQMPI